MSDLLPAAGESRTELIRGPAGLIEASFAGPRQPRAQAGYALICHPHPLLGGALSNKVVYTLASCAQKAGLYALRFNFRGVGRSEGLHDEGRGETDDTVFLAGWLRERLPAGPLVLMGFSFGAWVSTNAAARLDPLAQVSIAPPFAKYFDHLPKPARPRCPWLVVHSTDDDVVEYETTRAMLDTYDPPPQLVTFDGAGHFFHGRLNDLTDTVLPFLQTQLAVS
jgi:alpha/beta superfamily hydrolase